MQKLRPSSARGHANFGWLESHHTFSFGDYYDPRHEGFETLRVINDDRVAAGRGFGTHGHKDMEIISYVLEGSLEHRDSMGTAGVLRPGDVQRMSAGTGVMHSEANPSKTEVVHFLQIWLLPAKRGLTPSYEQKAFSVEAKRGKLAWLATSDGRDGSMRLNTDALVGATILEGSEQLTQALAPGRSAWVHLVKGALLVNGQRLETGDGLAISAQTEVKLEAVAGLTGEALVFDLPHLG
jgi:redox-sensitive bicupin YhaK (pirin superfamily)